MRDLRLEIEKRTVSLSKHPFLVGLENSNDPGDLRRIVPPLYFWVFAFQDVLRLSETAVRDPHLRAIAKTHRDEDAGHERWFSSDATLLGVERDVDWIFGVEHRPTRDTSYEMISEVLSARDDRIRLLLPLILEAIGSTFFPRVVGLVERTGIQEGLAYFARSHQDVEAGHDMFGDETSSQLDAVEFDEATYAEGLAVTRRCFARAETLAAHLEAWRCGELS